MVSSTRTANLLHITARPNQSASWNANVFLLLALCVPVLGIAIVLATLGAWLVLPFAGLEMLALAAALYRVNYKLQFHQVITVSDDRVCIAQGYRTPQQQWQLARESSGLTITEQPHSWDNPLLCVHDRDACVTLGAFLNREDSLKLLALLQQEIRVQAYSPAALREF